MVIPDQRLFGVLRSGRIHRQSPQETMPIPQTTMLRKQSEARSSDWQGHCTVPMVPYCTLHLGKEWSIYCCKHAIAKDSLSETLPVLRGSDRKHDGMASTNLLFTEQSNSLTVNKDESLASRPDEGG